MKFDNLYVPDPYSGSILAPPSSRIFMSFPPKEWQTQSWVGDEWPFSDNHAEPFVPKVPMDFPDLPRKVREQAEKAKDLEAWNNLFSPIEKKNWSFTNTENGWLQFSLELAGRSRDSVSAEINDNNCIIVGSKTKGCQVGGTYSIPSPEKFDLTAAQLTMEHGLLTILFPLKKVEKKTIKLL